MQDEQQNTATTIPTPPEESSGNAALDKRLASGVLKGDAGTDTAQVWISAFLIAALGFIVYLGSFSILLHGDDLKLLHDSKALHRIVTATGALESLPTSPLSVVGLALGCVLTGGGVDGLHGLSILLHLGCAILVFLLARRLLPTGTPEALSMLAGMFFVAHPLVTGTVNYLVAFPVLQSAFFGLLALNLLLRGAAQSNFCAASLAGSIASFVLAFGSDTSTLLLPVLGIALIQLRPDGCANSVYARSATPVLVATSAVLWIAGQAAGVLDPAVVGGGFSAYLDAAGNLLLSVLWPWRTSVLPVSPGLLAGLAGAVLLLAALAAGLLRRQFPVVHAAAWVLLTLFSVACYTPANLAGTTRYLYLPFAGLAILLPWALARIQAPAPFRIAGGAAAALVLVLGFISFQRTETWKQPAILWSDEAERHPDSVEPLLALARFHTFVAQSAPAGNAPEKEKLFTTASNAWKAVLDRTPGAPEAEKNLGLLAVNLGNVDEARPLLESASAKMPEDQEVALYLGYVLEQLGRTGAQRDLVIGALRSFRRAASLGPLPIEAQARYGVLAASFGDLETGIPLVAAAVGEDEKSELKPVLDQFNAMAGQRQSLNQRAEEAQRQNPAGAESALIRAETLLMEGRTMSAFYLLQAVMAQSPENDMAWAALGMVSARLQGSENFLAEWGAGRAGNTVAWEQLAARCAMAGTWEASEAYLRHGLSAVAGAMPELKLAEIALQVKQPERAVAFLDTAQKAYPDSPQPWLQMADLNIAAQDFARARGQLDEAEKRGAAAEEVKSRRDKLGAGQSTVPTGIQRTVIQ